MKVNWYILVLIIGCVVLGALLMRSCQRSKAQELRYIDSLQRREASLKANQKESELIKGFTDSLRKKITIDSIKSKHAYDSSVNIIKLLRGRLSMAQDSSLALWKQLRTFYLDGDTTSLKTAYYALRDELDSTSAMMAAIQFQHERVEYNLRNESDSLHAIIGKLYNKLDALRLLLDQQTQIAEAANKDEGRIIAAKKRKRILDLIKDIGVGVAGLFLGSKL